VDQYKDIRHLYAVEGLSIRAIAKRLGISRNTVKRYCLGEILPWEKRPKVERQKKVITEEVREFVKQCFEKDKNLEENSTKRRVTFLLLNKQFQQYSSSIFQG